MTHIFLNLHSYSNNFIKLLYLPYLNLQIVNMPTPIIFEFNTLSVSDEFIPNRTFYTEVLILHNRSRCIQRYCETEQK